VTGLVWAALAFLAMAGTAVLGDMVSEEARDRLDRLPHAILRAAARRLPPEDRVTMYHDNWLPELAYILKGAEARPVTRLATGTWYALGILATSRRAARHLHPEHVRSPDAGDRRRAAVARGTLAAFFLCYLTGMGLMAASGMPPPVPAAGGSFYQHQEQYFAAHGNHALAMRGEMLVVGAIVLFIAWTACLLLGIRGQKKGGGTHRARP
jgi:hypothetical protein